MKKLFTVLFCICFLTVLLTTVAFAANISEAKVTVEEPKIGAKPSTTATVPEGESYYVKNIEWKGNFDENGCFKAGEMYEVYVDLGVIKGESKIFAGNFKDYTVNGYPSGKLSYVLNTKNVKMECILPYVLDENGNKIMYEQLHEAKCKVTWPEVGEKPTTTGTCSTLYTKPEIKVEWKGELDVNGCFKAGVNYTAYVTVEMDLSQGNRFFVFNKSLFTINGGETYFYKYNDYKNPRPATSVTFYATFAKLKEPVVSEEAISSVDTFPIYVEYEKAPSLSKDGPDSSGKGSVAIDKTSYYATIEYDKPIADEIYSWFTTTVTYHAKDNYSFASTVQINERDKNTGAVMLSFDKKTVVAKFYTFVGIPEGRKEEFAKITPEMEEYLLNHLYTGMYDTYVAKGKIVCPPEAYIANVYEYPVIERYSVSKGLKDGEEIFIKDLDFSDELPGVHGKWYRAGNGFVPAALVEITEYVNYFEGAPAVLKESPFEFAGGDGSFENPFLIETADQLNAVRKATSKHYKLIADIDLSNWGNWVPIGGTPAYGANQGDINKAQYGSRVFTGSFDGNGHVISGMTIKVDAKELYMAETGNFRSFGLFGTIRTDEASIKNLGMINYTIDVKYDVLPAMFDMHVGSIAGTSFGSNLENCYSAGGNINIDLGTVEKGYGSEIHHIMVGGIIGEHTGDIYRCYNTSNITLNAKNATNSETRAGGIAGACSGGCQVRECYNAGDITVGFVHGESWTYSYAAGIASNAYMANVPGIYGYTCDATNSFYDCYNTGDITANLASGIICYSGWDVYAFRCYNAGKLTCDPQTYIGAERAASPVVGKIAKIYSEANPNKYVVGCATEGGTNVSGDAWQKNATLGRPTLKWNPDEKIAKTSVTQNAEVVVKNVGTFTDVKTNNWFAESVQWAVDKKVTAGTTATTFSPDDTCTRAQIITFMFRANGSPEQTGANPFTDVKPTDYYYESSIWAYNKGMVSGTTFAPHTPCNRGDTVIYLWKNAGSPFVVWTTQFKDIHGREGTDLNGAVSWAFKNETTSGTSQNTFSPENICTRAQIVTFLYRAIG